MPTMVSHTQYFSIDELKCKCGECEYPGMDAQFMKRMELIRVAFGKPIVVNSAYRCPNYNGEVADTGANGPHTTGRAIDIRLAGELVRVMLILGLQMGMTGIGLKQHGDWNSRFIHFDDLETEHVRPRVWTYS